MTTAAILLFSGILIGAGIAIIWRDIQAKKRRSAFVSDRDGRLQAEPEVEITIAHTQEAPRSAHAATSANLAPLTTSTTAVAALETVPVEKLALAGPVATPVRAVPLEVLREPAAFAERPARAAPRLAAVNADTSQDGARHSLEQRWASLQPTIAAGIDRVNGVLAPAHLMIAASGEPSWSYKNRGYGAHRRLLLDGESLAWLRLELDADGRLQASLKAHKEERAQINASADMPAEGLNAARAAEMLSLCLKPAASYAARQLPARDRDEVASERAWMGIDATVASALKATNGALAQAGARLVPLAPPAWEAQQRRHRMTLCVEVNGADVARMHIERLPQEIEVAVGLREAHLVELGRRRRIPVDGLTVHALAEMVASCAWPAIARFREFRRPA
jgi:hypothetical protein